MRWNFRDFSCRRIHIKAIKEKAVMPVDKFTGIAAFYIFRNNLFGFVGNICRSLFGFVGNICRSLFVSPVGWAENSILKSFLPRNFIIFSFFVIYLGNSKKIFLSFAQSVGERGK